MNTDFFTPTAQTSVTLTNFETGLTYSAFDIFKNLFRSNRFTTLHFTNTADEWDAEHNLSQEINSMFFGSPYLIGSKGNEVSEEVIEDFKKNSRIMVQYLLWDAGSPLRKFKKEYRKMFVKDGEATRLNVDEVESLFGIGLSKAARQYAESFKVDGEAGDWYMTDKNGGTSNFAETRLRMVAKFIKVVLNIYTTVTEHASTRLSEGHLLEHVEKELQLQAQGVQELVDTALAEAKVEPREVHVIKQYSTWVVRYPEQVVGKTDGETVYVCENYVKGHTYATARNEQRYAMDAIGKNNQQIADLEQMLKECEDKRIALNDEALKSSNALDSVLKLARFL